ncbi:endonuclease/exonuclease/phosphatase family protein [Bacteroides xylanisolvens]|nr:endonuclease/exonuclease/phosphatase family protein [Bacteroides xylanisolvens]
MTKPKEVTVKAMTYNTYSGRKQGIDKIAEVIKKENPDIVSLQEIERNTEINPWDTPKKLSELTGMKYYYFAHALDIPTWRRLRKCDSFQISGFRGKEF